MAAKEKYQIVDRLIESLRRKGEDIIPLSDYSALTNLEMDHRIRLPEDLTYFLKRAGGKLRGEFAFESDVAIWDLKRICAETDGYLQQPSLSAYDRHVLFADFLHWCWGYSVDCSPSSDWYGSVYLVGEGQFSAESSIAGSFSEFVTMCERGDSELM